MNRADLQRLARVRLSEARALLAAGHYDGAYYLAGYSVECALKACIARKTQRYDFPDRQTVNSSYVHDVEKLVAVAGLKEALDEAKRRDPAFEVNWTTVKDWSEASRYLANTETKASDLVRAIDDQRHGVLRWLRQHW